MIQETITIAVDRPTLCVM